MSDQFFWFATRAAGIMTWFSATLSLCVGLMMSSRALGRRPTIPWLLDVHRYTAAMSMVFLFLHLFTLWADSFVELSLADFVVPGRANVPGLTNLSVAWGVIAAWILVVVQASSLVKKYLAPDWWHTIHLMSFGIVIAGLAHAVQAGSDADNRIIVAVAASLLTAITLLLATRILRVLLDRKYQFDRANDADGTADYADEGHPLDSQRDQPAPTRQVAVAVAAATNSTSDGAADEVDYRDVDLDAYAYGDFSHLPLDQDGDANAGHDGGSDQVSDQIAEPVTEQPTDQADDGHDDDRDRGGPQTPGGRDSGGGRSTTSVMEQPEKRWGGPGSFAKPLPEVEGRPRGPVRKPRPEEGKGPPPIRR